MSSVAIFEQCGGSDLNPRFQRCDPGLICYARSTFYANCRRPNTCPPSWACTVVEDASTVIPPPRIIAANERCDNQSYTICASGTRCFRRTPSESECHSQCQTGWTCDTGVAQEFEQCGEQTIIASSSIISSSDNILIELVEELYTRTKQSSILPYEALLLLPKVNEWTLLSMTNIAQRKITMFLLMLSRFSVRFEESGNRLFLIADRK
ncbi:unnamed protein product [Rotaria sp. Silwood1]|nr:unnamed protein product [Rotaria sp. Silwood1]